MGDRSRMSRLTVAATNPRDHNSLILNLNKAKEIHCLQHKYPWLQ
jgi:hypothetical protein